MDVIARHNAADNGDVVFRANPTDDLANPTLDVTPKNLETIFGGPHHVITVIENAMFDFFVLHNHTLQKNEPQTYRAVHFSGEYDYSPLFALKLSRLEDGGFKPRRGY